MLESFEHPNLPIDHVPARHVHPPAAMTPKKVWYAPHKFEAYGDAEIDAVTACLKDGWLAGLGPKTEEFERQVSAFFGKQQGVFVNSGSSACLLALACLQLPTGAQVVTPACTFSTTVAPIIQLGLQPVFVDVGLTTYVPDVDDVLSAVTPATRAIMIPNLIGNKPDWAGIKAGLTAVGRDDVVLIEDSADTMTHTPETDIATVSFYASHVITAGGMGGMVMTNDKKLAIVAKQFRDWGRIGEDVEDPAARFAHSVDGIPYDFKFLYGVLGYNMKGSEMCAAFGLVQMQRLHKILAHRRSLVERYKANLAGVPGLLLPDDSLAPNWLAIPPQHADRLDMLYYLEDKNIQTRVTFAGNVTRHPAYRQYLTPFANADTIMRNGILLGSDDGMVLENVDYVCAQIKAFVAGRGGPMPSLHEADVHATPSVETLSPKRKVAGMAEVRDVGGKQETVALPAAEMHEL